MKKTLRLLLFEECNRNCPGCCNKDFDLVNLPVNDSYTGYDEIILTGGEPLLNPDLVYETTQKIKEENTTAKIILYTAKPENLSYRLLSNLDGLTVTLHTFDDHENFDYLNDIVDWFCFSWLNLRLNIFKESGLSSRYQNSKRWIVKPNIEWIEDCPLPTNEVFKRLPKGNN